MKWAVRWLRSVFCKICGLFLKDGDIQELLPLPKAAKNNYTRKILWTLCPEEISVKLKSGVISKESLVSLRSDNPVQIGLPLGIWNAISKHIWRVSLSILLSDCLCQQTSFLFPVWFLTVEEWWQHWWCKNKTSHNRGWQVSFHI